MKCSRVVAILTEDARFFRDGKNGKPDRILRRKAENRDDGIRSCSSSCVERCCSVANGGGDGERATPGKTYVLDVFASGTIFSNRFASKRSLGENGSMFLVFGLTDRVCAVG